MPRLSPSEDIIKSWPARNPINPESRTDSLRAGLVAAEALALTIIILRLYTRAFVVKGFGVDDLLVALASALSLATLYVALRGLNSGWGLHMWDIEPSTIADGGKLIYIATVGFIPVTYLTKASILVSYLRISPNVQFRNQVYILLTLISMAAFAIFLPTIFQCAPIRASWEYETPGAKCLDVGALLMSSAAINSLGDIMVAAFPAPMLWKANLPRKERMGLVVLFSIAGMVCLIGIARGATLHEALFDGKFDYSWSGGAALILGGVECNAGMIAASLPALRPLWSRYIHRKDSAQEIEELAGRWNGKVPRGGASPGAVVEQDLERGIPQVEGSISTSGANQGSFAYAATIPTPAPKLKTSEKRDSITSLRSPISPRLAKNPFRSLEYATKIGRRRSSIEASSSSAVAMPEANGGEGWRASTGRTWLSLEEEEEEDETDVNHPTPGGLRPHTSPWQERCPNGGNDLPQGLQVPQLKKSRSEVILREEGLNTESPPPSPSQPNRKRGDSVAKSEAGFSYASTPITPTIPSRAASSSSSKMKRNTQHESLNAAVGGGGGGGFSYATTSPPSPTDAPSPKTPKTINLTTALLSNATAAAVAFTIPLSTKKSTATLNTITACSSDSGAEDPQVESSRKWYGLSSFSKARVRGSTFDSTETFKLGEVDQSRKRGGTT